jgi:HK97 gp10 family phage protein
MAGLTLEIKGLSDAIKKMKAFEGEKKAAIANGLKEAAFNIEADAKTAAPVDMGFLRQNIRVTEVTETSAEVVSDANYSPYVEFGTGGLVDVPKGLEDYAIQFKGQGIKQVNLPARPFFFPAVYKHYAKLIEEFKKIV